MKILYKILTTAFITLAVTFLVCADNANSKKQTAARAFFNAREHQTSYSGPGREESCPAGIEEVLIGYFGPADSSHPQYGDMWSAASLAVEQANKAGGYRGLPFRLISGWSDNPWGTGISTLVRMVYTDRVWAVIGGTNGPSTHLVEQVAAKARLPVLSPASTDKTVNLANVPWIFSCLPADHLQTPVLADAIESHIGQEPFILVSATDHDSHLFTVELLKSLARRRSVPAYHFEFKPDENKIDTLTEKIANADPHALVLIADASVSARILRVVREKEFTGLVFGGPCIGQRNFLEQAGKAADNLIFPLLYNPGKTSKNFDETFTNRFGRHPDYLAAHTHDAVNLLIAAIRKAGLNRARICDQIRDLSPWHGVTGNVDWDPLGSNLRLVELATVRNGRAQPLSQIQSSDLTYSSLSNRPR
jgi:branched-chain amino acid transport system substrate-binding protein